MEDTTSTTTDTFTAASTTDPATSPDTTVSRQAQTATAERPKSFGEAIERLTAQDDSTPEHREAATTAQTATEKTVAGDKSPARKAGPIPFDVHETALKNARTKAVDEAKPQIEAEIRKTYAWADVIEEPDREELTALYRGLKTDLIGTLTTLIDNASQHPEHAKTLRSQAARLLSAARRVQGEASTEDTEPEPDIPLEDGRAVYSAAQQRTRDEWLIRRVSAQFDQKLQPFQQDREHAAEEARYAAAWQRAHSLLTTMREKPYFKEHEKDIDVLMDQHPDWTVADAYNDVLITKVLPTSEGNTRAAVLADLHHKANAGTLNPQQTTTARAHKPDGNFTIERIKQKFEELGMA